MHAIADPKFRRVCWRCRRPRSVCWCAQLVPVESQTRVVFLQHPRESRVPISTCRMAHLSLPNSELHVGLGARGNSALEAVCAEGDAAVLFPSSQALDVSTLRKPPKVLLVVDGTWSNAKKVVEKCPLLSALPRLKFFPVRPGAYRIRKEPAEHCLSTIEAVAQVLELLERAPGRFTPMLRAFDAMVEGQLRFVDGNGRSSRHRFRRRRNSVADEAISQLRAVAGRLVVVFGEANAWPADDIRRPLPDEPELIQLVSARVQSGERFETLLSPLRPLGPHVPMHLDLPANCFEEAPSRQLALERWAGFLRPDDILLGWGGYCAALLHQEGALNHEFINLRSALSQVSSGRLGSVEACATRLNALLPEGRGRAARRLEALLHVGRAMLLRPALKL